MPKSDFNKVACKFIEIFVMIVLLQICCMFSENFFQVFIQALLSTAAFPKDSVS